MVSEIRASIQYRYRLYCWLSNYYLGEMLAVYVNLVSYFILVVLHSEIERSCLVDYIF